MVTFGLFSSDGSRPGWAGPDRVTPQLRALVTAVTSRLTSCPADQTGPGNPEGFPTAGQAMASAGEVGLSGDRFLRRGDVRLPAAVARAPRTSALACRKSRGLVAFGGLRSAAMPPAGSAPGWRSRGRQESGVLAAVDAASAVQMFSVCRLV